MGVCVHECVCVSVRVEGQCPPCDNGMGAELPTPLTPVQYMQHTSRVTCEKHIRDVEAIGHDHIEETMGYEHTVEGTSALHVMEATYIVRDMGDLKRHRTNIFELMQL